MAIQSTSNRADYTPGNGVKIFTYSFPVYTLSDLSVYTVDTSFVVTKRTLNGGGVFDYTQTAANVPGGVAGGSVTFNTAPDAYQQVILLRTVPFAQGSSYHNFQGIDGPLGLEKQYDLLVMQIQQLQEQLNRVVKFPLSVVNPPTLLPDLTNPNNWGGFLQFAADGSSVIVGPGNGGTINITYGVAAFANRKLFVNTGADTWLVPANVNRIKVQIWGAGGGGGGGGGAYTTGGHGGTGENGAPGGYVTATLNVTPGQTLYAFVGLGTGGGLGGAAGTPGADGAHGAVDYQNTILADHVDYTTGKFIKATSGASGQGGLRGISDGTAAPTPGVWHEAPASYGSSLTQGWVADFTVKGQGANGGSGGGGGIAGGAASTAGNNGSTGFIAIWY